jgi:hypothetical protein
MLAFDVGAAVPALVGGGADPLEAARVVEAALSDEAMACIHWDRCHATTAEAYTAIGSSAWLLSRSVRCGHTIIGCADVVHDVFLSAGTLDAPATVSTARVIPTT